MHCNSYVFVNRILLLYYCCTAIAAADWAEKFPKFKLHRVTCRDDDGRWPVRRLVIVAASRMLPSFYDCEICLTLAGWMGHIAPDNIFGSKTS